MTCCYTRSLFVHNDLFDWWNTQDTYHLKLLKLLPQLIMLFYFLADDIKLKPTDLSHDSALLSVQRLSGFMALHKFWFCLKFVSSRSHFQWKTSN